MHFLSKGQSKRPEVLTIPPGICPQVACIFPKISGKHCNFRICFLKILIIYSLKKLFILFIFYFWLHWVFVAVCGLSLVAASGGYSSLRCAGSSLQWLLLLQSTGSRHVGFSSCGMQAQ